MRIAVVGAGGFLGSALVARLAGDGYAPIAIARRHLPLPGPVEQRTLGDLPGASVSPALFEGADVVVNCVAMVPGVSALEIETSAVEVNADFPLLLAQAAYTAGVTRFVQMSSVKVFGETSAQGVLIDDSHAEAPDGAYGRQKLAADQALAGFSPPSMPIISLRPPVIVGPGLKGALSFLVRAAKAGLPLPIGSVDNQRSFIYIDNAVDAVITAAKWSMSGSFIITDSSPLSTAALYRKMLGPSRRARVWHWPKGVVGRGAELLLRERAVSLLGNAAYSGERFAKDMNWCAPISFDTALAAWLAR